jgi:UDPglucose 6-dehydrogenase
VRGKTIAVLGLTFKPNTDDMREAPAIEIITALQDAGAKVRVHDPEGMEQARSFLEDVAYADDPYSCAEGAEALVIVTEWDAFRALDFARLSRSMAAPVLVDLRNIYRPGDVSRAGFKHIGVGLGEMPSDNTDVLVAPQADPPPASLRAHEAEADGSRRPNSEAAE